MEALAKYQETIEQSARMGAGIGIPGSFFPPLDMAAMSFIWIKMTRDVARLSGHQLNWFFTAKLIYAITAGSLLYLGGSKLLNTLLHAIPGAGTVTAAGANSFFNYIYTKKLGNMLAAQFARTDFNHWGLMEMADKIASKVFNDVSVDEIADAHQNIGTGIEYKVY